jgi:RNA polymerase primary sigma factor
LAAGRQAQARLRALREAGQPIPQATGVRLLAQVQAARQARQQLILACTPLVEGLARQYSGYNVPYEDLLQDGWAGVVQAAVSFDPAKGPHFSRHAAWGARKAILGALTSRSRLIRLPAGVVEAIRQISAARHQWAQTAVDPPAVADLAQMTGLATERVRQVLGVMDPPLSLDAPGSAANEQRLGDAIADQPSVTPENAGLAAVQRQELGTALAGLDPVARQVVIRRFGLGDGVPHALDEVAAFLHLSEAEVRALETAALDTLRALLTVPAALST